MRVQDEELRVGIKFAEEYKGVAKGVWGNNPELCLNWNTDSAGPFIKGRAVQSAVIAGLSTRNSEIDFLYCSWTRVFEQKQSSGELEW